MSEKVEELKRHMNGLATGVEPPYPRSLAQRPLAAAGKRTMCVIADQA